MTTDRAVTTDQLAYLADITSENPVTYHVATDTATLTDCTALDAWRVALNVQQFDVVVSGHERAVATFREARDRLESSARLVVAAAVAAAYPDARWVVLGESDQGPGL